MEREVRLQAISLSDTENLVTIADEILGTIEVEVVRGPTVGLLMVRVEEPSARLPFNFAEVTVSEAEILAGGKRGYAMVMGREPEKALAGAIIDGAIEAGHPVATTVERSLQDALDRESARQAREWAQVAGTMVKFEEMAP